MSEFDAVTPTTSRTPFVLHVVWHPECAAAPDIADALHRHFGSGRYDGVAGGAGVTVLLRDIDVPGSTAPPPIDWESGEIVAVVALVDHAMTDDQRWAEYLATITSQAETLDLAKSAFHVTLDGDALDGSLRIHALRWDKWPEGGERINRLIRELTDSFTRMLRHHLGHRQGGADEVLRRYRENVQVFLSHSKHDAEGEAVASAIRDWLQEHSGFASFLDVKDMLPGVPFSKTIEDAIQHGVLVAIYTDSYSSREWCRREALLAKRHGVPMVVVDSLQDKDDRAFPYLWNVPVVRMTAGQAERAGRVAAVLLDEVFKDYLWQQRTAPHRQAASHVVFTPRSPELTTAAVFADKTSTEECAIVYPDPPLGWEERCLFEDVLPNIRVCTMREWAVGE